MLKISPKELIGKVTGQCEQGTSWLELLCLFGIFGGQLQKKILETKLTLRKALALFKHTVGSVVHLYLFREDAFLWRASRSPSCRLRAAGITNFVPCINGLVVLEAAHSKQLLLGLVALTTGSRETLGKA